MGHDVIDRLAAYFDSVQDRPVFPNVEPAEVNRLFEEGVPSDGTSAEAVLAELDSIAAPATVATAGPRYFGFVTGGSIFVEEVQGRAGFGLGLTFCQMAVQAHGGSIWAANESSGGCRFSFTLPRAGDVPPGADRMSALPKNRDDPGSEGKIQNLFSGVRRVLGLR